ncbi:MAG: hypothetical protein FJX02_10365 [Alphaproteobacteria bacterium]|nr:hypothetical protein [Alphaproteobacteria bacterium]
MIERLTYLCGIAVAVITWAIGQLVADLTSVPVLHMSTKSIHVSAKFPKGATSLKITNLSRSKQIRDFKVNVFDENTGCSFTTLPSGLEWVLDREEPHQLFEVHSLMPGNGLTITVNHVNKTKCNIRFSFRFSGDTGVRMISSGVESFLLFNWLYVVVGLVVGGAVVVFFSLRKAYQLSAAS